MSNDFNIIYSFLAKFGGKDAWVDKADTNVDEVVTINEFRTLIDSNWDKNTMGKLPENDLINRFFRNFDTNNSGANKDRIPTGKGSVSNLYAWSSSEYSEMEDNVEKFVTINELLKEEENNIRTNFQKDFNCYACTSAYNEFIKAVKGEITNQLSNLELGKINKEGLNDILKSENITELRNKYLTDAVIETLGKNSEYTQLEEHGYKITEDSDLRNKIAQCIKDNGIENIDLVVQKYLEGDLGDGETLTAGQKDYAGAVLRKILLEALQSEADYDIYKAAYESAVDEYVAEVKEGAKKMSDIIDKTVEHFQDSKMYETGLKEKIALQEKAEEAMNNFNDFMDQAIDSLNNDTVEALIGDDLKNELKEALKNSILNGEEINDIVNWLSNQLNVRLEKVFSNGYSGIDNEKVQEVHDYRMGVIANTEYPTTDGRTRDDIRLEYTQNAAIDYCTWLAGKSAEHKEAVENVLGSDIEGAIKKLGSTNLIKTKLQDIKNACNKIITPSNITINWDQENAKASIKSGTNATIKPTFNAKQGNDFIESDNFDLKPECNIGKVSYDGNGGIKIEAPNTTTEQEMEIKVYVTYKGEVVGTANTITITVTPVKKNMELSDTNCSDSVIKSGHTDKERDITKTRTNAISKMKDFVEKKYQELLPNFDSSILRAAADETIRYYTSCINAISDPGHDDWYTTTLSATNADGDAFSYWYNGNNGDRYCDFAGTDTAFQLVENTCSALGSNHWYEIAIGEKALLEYFVDKYNEIAAKDGYKNNNDGGILDLT